MYPLPHTPALSQTSRHTSPPPLVCPRGAGARAEQPRQEVTNRRGTRAARAGLQKEADDDEGDAFDDATDLADEEDEFLEEVSNGFFKERIDDVVRKVSLASDELAARTTSNSTKIRAALETIRKILIVLAAVMLILAFAVLVFSACGLESLVYVKQYQFVWCEWNQSIQLNCPGALCGSSA